MRHRLLTLVSFLSLLLCVGAATLWVRSYFVSDFFACNTVDPRTLRCVEFYVQTGRGLVFSQRAVRQFTTLDAVQMFEHDMALEAEKVPGLSHSTGGPRSFEIASHSLLTSLGFWSDSFHNPAQRVVRVRPVYKELGTLTIRGEKLFFPLWFVALMFAPLPALQLRSALRQRRLRREHLCPACGYDLTANTSGICPECGAPTQKGQTAG